MPMQNYHLDCPCGATIPVTPVQAGGSVVCDACGEVSTIPTLRAMKLLPAVVVDPADSQPVPSDVGPAIKGVDGWLAFLCFGLVVGNPVRTVYQWMADSPETSRVLAMFPRLRTIFLFDTCLTLVLMLFSVVAGLALWNRYPNAVGIAKAFLLSALGYSVLTAFLMMTADLPAELTAAVSSESAKTVIQSLIVVAVWYAYLSFSKRVKNTYPQGPSERTIVPEASPRG